MFVKKDPLLILEDVSLQLDRTLVLSQVHFALEEGSFTLFVGPNGGGKTSLMKLLMGVYQPTKGTIKIAGASPSTTPTSFGYVPQSFLFDPFFPISVLEFVLMGALSQLPWYGFWPKNLKNRALEALDAIHLRPLAKKPFSSLSGGQQKRAALARAVLGNPKILILDEPTTGLDTASTQEFQEMLLSLKGKLTILLVTHTLPAILPAIDTILCVQNTVQPIAKENLCQHVTLGLYHPLTEEAPF